jgi:ribosome maturation factor RimP
MSTELLANIEALIMPILTDFGMELVDLEFKREGRSWCLRLFIDKPGGITLDDCVDVSRDVSAILEVEDPIPSAYRLEVSSPGLDRPLKKPADFERFTGHLMKLKTRALDDPDGRGQRRKTFVGELLGCDGKLVHLRQTDRRGGDVAIALTDIEIARLEPQF